MKVTFALFLSLLCMCPAVASTEETQYVFCRNRETVRTIRLQPATETDPCVTVYTKGGVDKVVGSGRHTTTCVKVLENIKDNLQEASWSCKDLSESQVSRTTASE